MALDGHMLQCLPADWQQKIHAEFQTKLRLCIDDDIAVQQAADHTWQTLIKGTSRRICKFEEHQDYIKQASDFAEWVLGFVNQALIHFQKIGADGNGLSNTPVSTQDTVTPATHTAVQRTYEHGAKIASLNDGSDTATSDTNFEISRTLQNNTLKQGYKSSGVTFGNGHVNGNFWHSHGATTGGKSHRGLQVQNQPHVVMSEVDPLDDTLDNLILKQKLNRLQGKSHAPLGVLTRSTKFSPVDTVNIAQSPSIAAMNCPDPRYTSPGTEAMYQLPQLCIWRQVPLSTPDERTMQTLAQMCIRGKVRV
ncbi:uncharacterized protein BXIN_2347 [Babesia sp. Xinjiang]|uniref:uncharacterized protein n=1 Tax=Babesia sp. Xinjiang TaxID=462227 RepID=UPI000A21A87E|nr:uncharacterized protein BXIN_2347 [Babesia sp. Xinjiang]ORM40697.1 hypothetical protein BXIN_2347 [Babesia sp. Xinjiang]